VREEPERPVVEGAWAWSDAWVLTAACIRETNPVSLVDLIEAADYINHAVLLDEEINGAVARLAAADLVELAGHDVLVTARGRQLYEEATEGRPDVIAMTNAVSRALYRIELPDDIAAAPQIPEAVLREVKERWRDDLPPELAQQA
jgi:hypothetical protein